MYYFDIYIFGTISGFDSLKYVYFNFSTMEIAAQIGGAIKCVMDIVHGWTNNKYES